MAESGDHEKAMLRLRTALRLEPNLISVRADLARVYALHGDWTEVDAVFANAPATAHETGVYMTWLVRARFAMWRRDVAAAEKGIRALEQSTNPSLSAALPLFRLVVKGEASTDTEEVSNGMAPRDGAANIPRRRSFMNQMRCEVHAFPLGNTTAALEDVAEADAALLLDVAWLDLCPLLDPLRQYSGFREVRNRVAARAAEVLVALEAT